MIPPPHPDTARIRSNNEYLAYYDQTPRDQATAVVHVIAVRDGSILGTIKWFGRWRKYAFHPAPGCVFDPGCLEDIAINTVSLTTTRKERNRRERAPARGGASFDDGRHS